MSLSGEPDESQETVHGFQTVPLRRGKLDRPRQFRHAFDGGILVVQLRERARFHCPARRWCNRSGMWGYLARCPLRLRIGPLGKRGDKGEWRRW